MNSLWVFGLLLLVLPHAKAFGPAQSFAGLPMDPEAVKPLPPPSISNFQSVPRPLAQPPRKPGDIGIPCVRIPFLPIGDLVCTLLCLFGYDIIEGRCDVFNNCICVTPRY